MDFLNNNSDEKTILEIGKRIAQYRLNRNLTQSSLAEEAGISKRTLMRVEHGQSTHITNMIRILRVLDLLENLEVLIPQPAISPIQQVKMKGKSRQRASSPKQKSTPKSPWSWGDKK